MHVVSAKFCLMDNFAHDEPEVVAKRLRIIAASLTDPADIAAVNKYADELERSVKAQRAQPRKTKNQP